MKYGWKRELPDHRDFMYSLAPVHLPIRVELTETGCMPTVYNQGSLGSCTANAIAAAVDFARKKQGEGHLYPSRLFIYYNEREMEGSVDMDAGANIRDGIKTIIKQGVCPEDMWPYVIDNFNVKPNGRAYAFALDHQTLVYQRVNNTSLREMKNILASGFPIIGGFTVYESFESGIVAATGIVPMPAPEEKMIGGHAILVVGYNDRVKRFIVRNSWGDGWGKAGYFSIPYDYLTNPDLADDYWVVRKEE